MAQNKPIGVRFNQELLQYMKEKWGNEVTAQRALRAYEDCYRKFKDGILVLKPQEQREEKQKEVVEQKKISTADGYYDAIKATKSADEIKGIIKMAKSDSTLTDWQKSAIERNGLDKIKNL